MKYLLLICSFAFLIFSIILRIFDMRPWELEIFRRTRVKQKSLLRIILPFKETYHRPYSYLNTIPILICAIVCIVVLVLYIFFWIFPVALESIFNAIAPIIGGLYALVFLCYFAFLSFLAIIIDRNIYRIRLYDDHLYVRGKTNSNGAITEQISVEYNNIAYVDYLSFDFNSIGLKGHEENLIIKLINGKEQRLSLMYYSTNAKIKLFKELEKVLNGKNVDFNSRDFIAKLYSNEKSKQ